MIKQLRFRLISLIGLLYRRLEEQNTFLLFFLLFKDLLGVVFAHFRSLVLIVVAFYSIWLLLCSHHAKRTHHTIIKQISIISSVLLFDADCGTQNSE